MRYINLHFTFTFTFYRPICHEISFSIQKDNVTVLHVVRTWFGAEGDGETFTTSSPVTMKHDDGTRTAGSWLKNTLIGPAISTNHTVRIAPTVPYLYAHNDYIVTLQPLKVRNRVRVDKKKQGVECLVGGGRGWLSQAWSLERQHVCNF